VGCCSLRVEHLSFDPNGEGGDNKEIELKFLGKDSMLYQQTIDFGATMYNENFGMGSKIYDNLKGFCAKRKKTDEVFDAINPTMLNNHLKQFMEGLSAKVFRTYNASRTLQEELAKTEGASGWSRLPPSEKVVEYNSANREVAILCNHQRSVSKAQETQLDNIGAKIETLKKQKKMLKGILKCINADKLKKIPLKKNEKELVEKSNNAIAKAKKMKEKAKTNDEKIKATEADEAAKKKKREVADTKFQQGHLWEKVPTKDQVIKRIQNWSGKISKMEMDLKHKDDNKEVSLGTSKVCKGLTSSMRLYELTLFMISPPSSSSFDACLLFCFFLQINYMDPRITVAWCKRNEVPIEKVFSKTLRDKFNWAMAVEPDWEFNAKIADQ
jgi:DNA topoisomerase-1